MKKIALVYGTTLGSTETVAELIAKHLALPDLTVFNVADTSAQELNSFDALILGSSTWGLGDWQDDWDQFDHKNLVLTNKTVALFGLGDSEVYAYTYCDALFQLYKLCKRKRANLVGFCPASDYEYTESSAVLDDYFVGLAIDHENYEDLTKPRVIKWTELIRKHFT